jgi:hypothetical protein
MTEVTQADRDRAKEIEAFFGAVWSEGNFNGLIGYLARHRVAAQEAAIMATIKAAANECKIGAESYMKVRDAEKSKRIARDFETMAIALVHGEYAVRALSVEQIMKGMEE